MVLQLREICLLDILLNPEFAQLSCKGVESDVFRLYLILSQAPVDPKEMMDDVVVFSTAIQSNGYVSG